MESPKSENSIEGEIFSLVEEYREVLEKKKLKREQNNPEYAEAFEKAEQLMEEIMKEVPDVPGIFRLEVTRQRGENMYRMSKDVDEVTAKLMMTRPDGSEEYLGSAGAHVDSKTDIKESLEFIKSSLKGTIKKNLLNQITLNNY